MHAGGLEEGGINDETPPGHTLRGLAPAGGPPAQAVPKLAPRAGLELI